MNPKDIKDAMEERYTDSDITRQNSILVPIHVLFDSYESDKQSHTVFYPGGSNHGSHNIVPKMHHHDYIEFMFILEGEIEQKIENSSFLYQKGDICLLNRSVRHYEIPRAATTCKIAYLCISCDYLKSVFNSNIVYGGEKANKYSGGEIYQFLQLSIFEQEAPLREYYDISPTIVSKSHQQVVNILDNISIELKNQLSGSYQAVQSGVARLIYLVEEPENYYISHRQLDSSTEDFIVSRVVNYLSERHGRVSWDELSNRLNYSAAYVNQIVKKHTGKSVLQLGKEYCLEEAKRLLRETDMSIMGVIHELDYKNSSYFYKLFFEQTGMTPRDYRESHQKPTE